MGRRRELVIPQLLTRLTIPPDVKWVKVRELKTGQRIATIDGWERIASIRKIGRKQTWDIEVEGTHNFIGNGIVAHNTTGILMRAGASSLQLSSSATSTTADIQLAAADRIDLFASSLSLSTSSRTVGELRLTSSGSLILDTFGAPEARAIVMLGGMLESGRRRKLVCGVVRLDISNTSGGAMHISQTRTGYGLLIEANLNTSNDDLHPPLNGGHLIYGLANNTAGSGDIMLIERANGTGS